MEELAASLIFVEGKRDVHSLSRAGLGNSVAVAGRTVEHIRSIPVARPVIVLTDIDRRGGELAIRIRDELAIRGINANIEMRQVLARMLGLKYFEEFDKKYRKFLDEVSN